MWYPTQYSVVSQTCVAISFLVQTDVKVLWRTFVDGLIDNDENVGSPNERVPYQEPILAYFKTSAKNKTPLTEPYINKKPMINRILNLESIYLRRKWQNPIPYLRLKGLRIKQYPLGPHTTFVAQIREFPAPRGWNFYSVTSSRCQKRCASYWTTLSCKLTDKWFYLPWNNKFTWTRNISCR